MNGTVYILKSRCAADCPEDEVLKPQSLLSLDSLLPTYGSCSQACSRLRCCKSQWGGSESCSVLGSTVITLVVNVPLYSTSGSAEGARFSSRLPSRSSPRRSSSESCSGVVWAVRGCLMVMPGRPPPSVMLWSPSPISLPPSFLLSFTPSLFPLSVQTMSSRGHWEAAQTGWGSLSSAVKDRGDKLWGFTWGRPRRSLKSSPHVRVLPGSAVTVKTAAVSFQLGWASYQICTLDWCLFTY